MMNFKKEEEPGVMVLQPRQRFLFPVWEPAPVRLTDPVLARLHRFVALVAGVLGCAPTDVLGDYRDIVPSEANLDKSFLTRVGRGAYLLAAALYRLQNQLCLNRLKIYHIVQYDEWTARFLVLLQCIRAGADESPSVAWFAAQTRFGAAPTATTAAVDYAPVDTPPQSFHDWVREAMRQHKAPDSTVELGIALGLAALGGGATLARVTRALHGRAEFARLAAAMVTPKAAPVDVTWLRGFLDRDCACSF